MASVIPKTDSIWFNGALIPWEEARVHVLSHALHYGTGVFEGMRCYPTADGPAVFRLDAHLRRFFDSAALYEIGIPYSAEQLADATLDVVRANRLENAYIRPIAFFGFHGLALWPGECPVVVAIAGWPMGSYHKGAQQGIRVTVSSVRRFDSAAIPAAAKACGQYVNSVRAVQEALRKGYDEAILLNSRGEVAEGSGENIFLVKRGTLVTNGDDASILMGITRESVIDVARDLGIPMQIRALSVDDLRSADELFFTGTAAEVTPISEIDGTRIRDGSPGQMTARLRDTFADIVTGKRAEYRRWLSYAAATIRH